MPNLYIVRFFLNIAYILLILIFFMENKWPEISLLKKYIQNLIIPLLTIIINFRSGLVGENPQRIAESPQRTAENPQRTAESPQRTAESPQRIAESPQRIAENPQIISENSHLIAENSHRNNTGTRNINIERFNSNENSSDLAARMDQHEESEQKHNENHSNYKYLNNLYKKK